MWDPSCSTTHAATRMGRQLLSTEESLCMKPFVLETSKKDLIIQISIIFSVLFNITTCVISSKQVVKKAD